MILYKTGDCCPCCGQPIQLKGSAELYAFSVVCEMTGLNNVGRTEAALREAIRQREERKEALAGAHDLLVVRRGRGK